MAIEKLKKTQDNTIEPVATVPDLETKRKQFQQAVKGKKVVVSTASEPKVHSARKRTIIIIVGALLLAVGSMLVAYAYFFWFNSPEKIVADALTNAASSRSVTFTAKITSDKNTVATIDGQYTDGKSKMSGVINTGLPGNLAKIDASVMATQRHAYVKLSDATKLAQTAIPSEQAQVIDLLLPVLQKQIDDKWIKMSTSDMALFQPATRVSSCSADGIKKLTTDQQVRVTLAQLYIANPFLVIEDKGLHGAQGVYSLSINKDTLNEFLDNVQTSDIKEIVAGCTEEITWIKKSDIGNVIIDLNIDTSTRTITQVKVAKKATGTVALTLVPQFDQQTIIDEPQAAVKLDDLKKLLYGAFQKLQAS